MIDILVKDQEIIISNDNKYKQNIYSNFPYVMSNLLIRNNMTEVDMYTF